MILCPKCGSDQVIYLGSRVTANDDFSVLYEFGGCAACSANLRYCNGVVEELTLEDALNLLDAEARRIEERLLGGNDVR